MKTKLLLSAFLGLASFITAQGQYAPINTQYVVTTTQGQNVQGNVNIPDPNFKLVLIKNLKINTNGDGHISVAEARAYTGDIFCHYENISDLTGIEAFVNIKILSCNNNKIERLDLSKNTALQQLDCSSNRLTRLDVSNNTNLWSLKCSNNQITSLDVSNNKALKSFFCTRNNLTSLNLKNGNNKNIYSYSTHFSLKNNPDLRSIRVDDVAYSNANWSNLKDDTAEFTN